MAAGLKQVISNLFGRPSKLESMFQMQGCTLGPAARAAR